MNKSIVCVVSLLSMPALQASVSHYKLGGYLYDNGPIITSTATGLNGADESILENNTLSMTSLGTAHSPGLNLRVADDFSITGTSWQINSIDFYAYQTGESASTIIAYNIRIWDGNPNDVNSSVVFGDTSTNRLSSTAYSGIVRVDENTTGLDDTRQIAISNVAVGIELPPGTYWLDWQSDGSGNEGPFVPHITIPGQTTTGNALLSTDNGLTYGNLQDNGTLTNQGLPFVINGAMGNAGQGPRSVPAMGLTNTLVLGVLFLLSLFFSPLKNTIARNRKD